MTNAERSLVRIAEILWEVPGWLFPWKGRILQEIMRGLTDKDTQAERMEALKGWER